VSPSTLSLCPNIDREYNTNWTNLQNCTFWQKLNIMDRTLSLRKFGFISTSSARYGTSTWKFNRENSLPVNGEWLSTSTFATCSYLKNSMLFKVLSTTFFATHYSIKLAQSPLNAGLICPSSLHLSPIIDTLTIYVNLEYASLSFAISRGISELGFGFK